MRKFILNSTISREYASRAVLETPIEAGKEIVIQNEVRKQTDDQRQGFHLLCREFAQWNDSKLGYTPEDIKNLVKIEAFGMSYSEVYVMGRKTVKEKCKSSTKWTRKEYSHAIETIYRLASEAGIILPELKR